MASWRIYRTSGPSWPGHGVIVMIDSAKVRERRISPMGTNLRESLTEDELPRPGVDDVIAKSYGHPCSNCGGDTSLVCMECGRAGAA